jgi:hypothetical protein
MVNNTSNKTVNKSSLVKNNKFYKQLTYIKKELDHYKKHFKNKIIFCNYVDPKDRTFWNYFISNFEFFGLRKLIATHFETDKPSYKLEIVKDQINTRKINKLDNIEIPLKENGDASLSSFSSDYELIGIFNRKTKNKYTLSSNNLNKHIILKNNRNIFLIFVMLFLALFIFPQNVFSYGPYTNPAPVYIGSADDLILFSKAGITDNLFSTIGGNIGVSPAAAATIVGVTCAQMTGRMHTITAPATPVGCITTGSTVVDDNSKLNAVKTDMLAAYTDARNSVTYPADETVPGAIGLTGTYGRGIYKFGGAISVGAVITFRGSTSDVFIFQVTGAYTQPVAGQMQLMNDSGVIDGVNGPQPRNIFWAIDGAVSTAAGTSFIGTILATGALSLGAGASLNGRALVNGLITTATSDISIPLPNYTACEYLGDEEGADTIKSGIGSGNYLIDGTGYVTDIYQTSNIYSGDITQVFFRYRTLFIPTIGGSYNFDIESNDGAIATTLNKDMYGPGLNAAPTLQNLSEVLAELYGRRNEVNTCGSGNGYSKFLSAGQGYWIDVLTTHVDKTLNSELCYDNGGGFSTVSTANLPGQLYAREYVTAEPIVTVNSFEDQYTQFPTNNTGLGVWTQNTNPQTISLTDGESKSVYYTLDTSTPFDIHYQILGILDNGDKTSMTNLSIIDLPTNTNLSINVNKTQLGDNFYNAKISFVNLANLNTPRFASLYVYLFESNQIQKTSNFIIPSSSTYTLTTTNETLNNNIYNGTIHKFKLTPTPSLYTTTFKPYLTTHNTTNSFTIEFNYTQNKTNLNNVLYVGFDPELNNNIINSKVENQDYLSIFDRLLQIFINLKNWFIL